MILGVYLQKVIYIIRLTRSEVPFPVIWKAGWKKILPMKENIDRLRELANIEVIGNQFVALIIEGLTRNTWRRDNQRYRYSMNNKEISQDLGMLLEVIVYPSPRLFLLYSYRNIDLMNLHDHPRR
jgi:hypothetical protein